MPAIEARISTGEAVRYLRQFCKHAHAMGSPRGHRMRMHGANPIARGDVRLRTQWSDTVGTVDFDPWGRCVLHADANTLAIRIDATDNQVLQRIQDIVDRDIDRFGGHRLAVTWERTSDSEGPA